MVDSLLTDAPVVPAVKPATTSRTHVLAVCVDVAMVQSLLPWRPAAALEVETANDFLSAVERLLGEEWDVVVAAVGDPIESDLRPWLEALEEARGHPRFIALVKQSSGVPAVSTPG